MRIFRSFIATVLLALSVVGMMLSMLHYHSEGLLCVHHAEEQHVTTNDLLCPIAGLTAITPDDAQPDAKGYFEYKEVRFSLQELLFSSDVQYVLLGRAPPFMI